jgi:hypothetical protein
MRIIILTVLAVVLTASFACADDISDSCPKVVYKYWPKGQILYLVDDIKDCPAEPNKDLICKEDKEKNAYFVLKKAKEAGASSAVIASPLRVKKTSDSVLGAAGEVAKEVGKLALSAVPGGVGQGAAIAIAGTRSTAEPDKSETFLTDGIIFSIIIPNGTPLGHRYPLMCDKGTKAEVARVAIAKEFKRHFEEDKQ